MNTVTVLKDRLRGTLLENRAKHAYDYEDAKRGFLETAEEKLAALLAEVRAGNVVETYLGLQTPESHLDDYDRAIQMLQWHTTEEVELTGEEFENLVMDKWQWKDRWSVSNSGYIQKARRR